MCSLNIRYRCIQMTKGDIVAAIQRAARELGRAPSRGELKSRTGVSHYRVLTQFRSLREAVRAAGLRPSAKGERVSTEELMRDWERVRKKLGRRPSRAEYVREGKYSAGTLVGRFGSWSAIGVHRGSVEAGRTAGDPDIGSSGHLKDRISRGLTRKARIQKRPEIMERGAAAGLISPGAVMPAAVPGELEGHRRVTELVAAMLVRTLVPSGQLVIGRSGFTPVCANPAQPGGAGWRRANFAGRGIYKDRPVMGPPFARHRLTNAPVNEMGVVFLFGAVAWELGFQVESLWTRGYPDGRARREVAPGKWQEVTIEFEYESKNFLLHGHDPKRCDVIVCWKHNWKECPEEIEVIELSKIFG
jgi:hypothetical protein